MAIPERTSASSLLYWLRLASWSFAMLYTSACVTTPQPARPMGPVTAPFVDAGVIDHVALRVNDIPTSAAWYEKMLGLTPYHKWDNAWLLRHGAISIGLYICEQCTPTTASQRTMHHFAFLVSPDEFKALQDRLKAGNVAFDGPRDTGVGFSIFVTDPDGYRLEFTYYHDTDPNAQ